MSTRGICRGCGAEILWVRMRVGKLNPCNPRRLTIVTEAGDVVSGFESHFATCPKAGQFRKAT